MSNPASRSRRSRHTRARLLQAAVHQVVNGEEPTMRSVARAAGVAERTIYRHFDGLQSLEAAVRAEIAPRVGAPLPERVADLPAYAEQLFSRFEENAELVCALVLRGTARMSESRTQNLLDLEALLRSDLPEADPQELAAAAAALRVHVSGAGWYYLRISCGLPQARVVDSARHAIGVHLAALSGPPA